jgi:predicted ATP-grasp superfamily ATP-dependent carboligase
MATGSYQWTDEPSVPGIQPGATILSSFPSAGLAATVAAHYIIRTLNLPRVGIMDASESLPIAVVQSGEVQPPMRIYGRPDLAVVVSEFPPAISAVAPIANAILDGAEARQAKGVVCLEGVVPTPASEAESDGPEETVWGVVARRDPATVRWLGGARVRFLEDGVIGGVSGAMLIGGLRRALPISVLLVSARESVGYPDHRAGAAVIEALDRLLPELKIDTGPLRVQAEMIEKLLRSTMKPRPTSLGAEAPTGETTMYQ